MNPNYNAEKDFNEKFATEAQKRKDEIKRPNILVCGYTGSGKSSLIRTILGDIVPHDAIGDGKPKTMAYDLYESDEIRLWDSRGLELGETETQFTEQTRDFINARRQDKNVDEHIHIVWYVIQGSGARVTDCDVNLVKNIFTPKNLACVITKADITRPNQLEAIKKRLQDDAGLDARRIVATSDAEGGSQGCADLVHLSYQMLPDAYKDAFMEAQRVDLEARIELLEKKTPKAQALVTAASVSAVGIGAIPIPLSDAVLLIPTQVTLIASLAALYGLDQEAIKVTALPFVARVAGTYTASSLLKFVPGLGSAVNATVAGGITAAMGWYVQKQFHNIALAKIKDEPPPQISFDFAELKEFYENYKKPPTRKP